MMCFLGQVSGFFHAHLIITELLFHDRLPGKNIACRDGGSQNGSHIELDIKYQFSRGYINPMPRHTGGKAHDSKPYAINGRDTNAHPKHGKDKKWKHEIQMLKISHVKNTGLKRTSGQYQKNG